MRYFHRTSVEPDRVIAAAVQFFSGRLVPAEEGPRRRAFAGPMGRVTVSARPEGGHYTFVEIVTDQVGESEIDKLAKRFLTRVHTLAHREHQERGAY